MVVRILKHTEGAGTSKSRIHPEYEGLNASRCHFHTSTGVASDTLNLFSVG